MPFPRQNLLHMYYLPNRQLRSNSQRTVGYRATKATRGPPQTTELNRTHFPLNHQVNLRRSDRTWGPQED